MQCIISLYYRSSDTVNTSNSDSNLPRRVGRRLRVAANIHVRIEALRGPLHVIRREERRR